MKGWAPGLKDNVELSMSKSDSSTNSLNKLVELILQKIYSCLALDPWRTLALSSKCRWQWVNVLKIA